MKPIGLSLPRIPAQPAVAGIAVAVAGLFICTVAAFAGPSSLFRLCLAVVASTALGWLVTELLRRSTFSMEDETARLTVRELPEPCRDLVSELVAGALHPDPVFRELLRTRLAALSDQVREWSHGQLIFTGTEAWRTAYEKVLTSPEVSEYRSVALLNTEDYWQDLPGQQGLRLNFELLDSGMLIERILIIGWNLWPPELRLPKETIRRWIDEQHYRGVSVLLVRENDLIGEPDLLRDFGIYGNRAVGELHIDGECRTVSFTLWFDRSAVDLARERWARLRLYARSYSEMLERAPAR